jgi:hypothetical protein
MDSFASHNLIASIFSEPETEGLPSTPVETDNSGLGGTSGANGFCTIS